MKWAWQVRLTVRIMGVDDEMGVNKRNGRDQKKGLEECSNA